MEGDVSEKIVYDFFGVKILLSIAHHAIDSVQKCQRHDGVGIAL